MIGGTMYIATDGSLCLSHHGVKGMKWSEGRYQNAEGSLTNAGKLQYQNSNGTLTNAGLKIYKKGYNKVFKARKKGNTEKEKSALGELKRFDEDMQKERTAKGGKTSAVKFNLDKAVFKDQFMTRDQVSARRTEHKRHILTAVRAVAIPISTVSEHPLRLV